MPETNYERIASQIGQLIENVHASQLSTSDRLTALEGLVKSESALCPFRESIARSSNNLARLAIAETRVDHVEDKMHVLELQFARAGIISGAAGGGIFSAVGLVVFTIGKGAGWW